MPETRLEQLCIEHGMKMTGQRRIIARVLSVAEDHPDVEEVSRRASENDSNISISTVYRTMKLLEDAGIVESHAFGYSRSRYAETSLDHRDHIIRIMSGNVRDCHKQEINRLLNKHVAE